jgi:low affinity Fe/Cu permease
MDTSEELSKDNTKPNIFERFSRYCIDFTGSTLAFISALFIILAWLITGPLFDFSDTWQLVINTGTTIITFLMVFLIQRAQNKDSRALHLKLNELIASIKGPSNRLIDVEELTERELETLSRFYRKLSEMAKTEKDLSISHSIEEAEELHKSKYPD